MTRLTATELARNLSAVLNRVAAGERIEIVRNGMSIAVIAPPERHLSSAEDTRAFLEGLPDADDGFAGEIDALRSELLPLDDPWQS